jgi:hypothetical protein
MGDKASRLGHIERFEAYAYHFKRDPNLTIVDHQTVERTSWGYGTHLTVYWRRSIKSDHVEDYGHKGGDARKGVNL